MPLTTETYRSMVDALTTAVETFMSEPSGGSFDVMTKTAEAARKILNEQKSLSLYPAGGSVGVLG